MINKKYETQRNSGTNHNLRKIFTTLGASNHTDQEREQHDYYATDPKALEMMEFIPCKTIDEILKIALEAK